MNAELKPRNRWTFHLIFPYSPKIVEAVRNTPGCSWSKVTYSWICRYIFYDLVIQTLKKLEMEIVVSEKVKEDCIQFKKDSEELEKVKLADGNECMELTKLKLDPHQRVGSTFLVCGERVLLADAVGLQKTSTALNACLMLKKLRDITHVLYVTINSCKWQVQQEIEKFTHEKAVVIDGTKAQREKQIQDWRYGGTMFLVVNYESIMTDVGAFSQAHPDIIIADEISKAKNFTSKTAKALRKIDSHYFWALGATPLENDFDEVFNILRLINPELLGNLTNFKTHYAKIGFWGEVKGWHIDRIKDFLTRIQPYILKRTNEDIGRELPTTTIKHHWVEMSHEQNKVYDDLKAKSKLTISVNGTTYSQMISVLTKLRETCDFSDLGDPLVKSTSTKLEELMSILREREQGDKFIIFTQWEQAAKRISTRLENENIKHVFVSGSVKGTKRQGVVKGFKEDPSIQALVTTDCLSYGMNLQEANRVIIFDLLYTPSGMTQRVGRIRRLGQTKAMTVHTLLCKNTVEERMLDILSRKSDYQSMLFDPFAKNVKLTMDDLKKIILSA
jgi:SNF2 family DNA or RNA helicase